MGSHGVKSGMSAMSNEERKDEKRLIELEGKSYYEFDDEPEPGLFGGSSEYYGDGLEQEYFFKVKSNHNELIDSMGANDEEAFYEWATGHFMDGQQWGGFGRMSARDQQYTRIYDKYLDNATLKTGLVVNRLTSAEILFGKGHKTATLEELQALRGSYITSKANMSCGVASAGLHIGDKSKNIELKIHIPGGTKGAGMWIGNGKINPWGTRQREYMTNRDSVYIVGKTTTRKDHNGQTVYVVHMYYDGRMAHDYS